MVTYAAASAWNHHDDSASVSSTYGDTIAIAWLAVTPCSAVKSSVAA